MDKNVIKGIILAQQERIANVELIGRNYDIEDGLNYVFVGLRRAGKTYLLYQYIQSLLARGVKKEEILFVNFEDERINDISKEELHLIIDAYREMYECEPIIFLDEIQNIKGWEHFVRRLADEKRRVFVTGSNARMLSREIATTLGGRFMIKEVYPFSFGEYLDYRKVELGCNWELSPQRADVVRLFENYFYWGGIAECFDVNDKRSWLTSLYQKVLYSDIVVRNGIRNEQGLNLLVKKLADSVLQPTSIKRLCDILKSIGQKVTRETIGTYIEYLRDAYLTFSIANFSDTIPERESTKKMYFYDNGLLNIFLYQPETKLLENMVAIELYKRYGEKVFYYRRNVEVDFVVPEHRMAIQVCYNMNDATTREREINALVALNKYLLCDTLIVITKDARETLHVGDMTIEVIPIWEYLLEEVR